VGWWLCARVSCGTVDPRTFSPLGHARGVKDVGAVLEAHASPAQAWHVELRADAVRGEWLASGGASANGAWCSCKGHCSNVPSSCARWQPLFWQPSNLRSRRESCRAGARARRGGVGHSAKWRAQRNRALEVLDCLCAHFGCHFLSEHFASGISEEHTAVRSVKS